MKARSFTSIGNSLRIYREEAQITQAKLGEMLYLSDHTISRWERGLMTPPLETIIKLADIYNCTVDELIRREEKIMKLNEDIETATYSYTNGFMVDIVKERKKEENGKTVELWNSWLYHTDYGVKNYMFGFEAYANGCDTIEDYIRVVYSNIDDYIEIYKDEVFD